MVEMAIDAAHRAGKKIGICGQAPSDYPEFARFLVEKGITSISLNPDTVLQTTQVILEAEAVLDLILIQFGAENISVGELREKKLNERDPLKAFSVSCRRELHDLQRVI